jgi:ATP-dependent Clp protease ATP-binding subunit ClpX
LHNQVVVEDDDLISFGFLPELSARFPFRIRFSNLNTDALKRIVDAEYESPGELYRGYLKRHDIALKITWPARTLIARIAEGRGNGARSLFGIMHTLLAPVIFDLDGSEDIRTDSKGQKELCVNKNFVRKVLVERS